MAKEYYVYPNGTPIAVAGNNEYATQIPMSANDATDVYTAINAKVDSSDLATVATTGSYADLSNTPSLATVATSGSYTDLSNKPTIPTNANYLERSNWWALGDTHNIDDLRDGIHFVYTSHNAPTTGTLITFSGNGGSSPNYCWQIIKQYSGHSVYVRSRNGDRSEWTVWKTIAFTDSSISGNSANVTGTVAIAHGGTGATTKNAAGTNLGFNWSGQSGQPSWLWGGNSQGTYYVYNPSNFNVNSAKTATTATKGNTVANWSGGGTSGNLRFHAQTSVIAGSGTGVQLVTAAALNTIFGVSNCGAGNTAVFVSNGDGNAWGGHFDGCNYISSGTPSWWATTNTSIPGTIRINWLAVYFG